MLILQAKVDEALGTIVWPNGANIDPGVCCTMISPTAMWYTACGAQRFKDAMEMSVSKTMDVTIVDAPQESLLALKITREEFAGSLRMAAARKYYEMGRLSSGAAARLAGVPRVVFLARLADYGIDTFRLTEDELRREARLVCDHQQHVPASVSASTWAA